MNALATVFYDWPRIVTGYLTWLAPLAVRIVVGWVFIWTGWQKLNFLPRMIENFREWGIPAPEILTPFVSGMEFVGGLAAAARTADAHRRDSDDDHNAGSDRLREVGRRRFAADSARLRGDFIFRDVRVVRYRRAGTGVARSFRP